MKILSAIVGAAIIAAQAAVAHEEHEHAAGAGIFGQSPEYVHVLLNPLPFYGLALGLLALAAALWARSHAARVLALSIVIFSSAAAWPVAHYGENAYERVRQTSDEPGRHWLDEHMARAEKFIYAFYATALLGLAALISLKKFPKTGGLLAIATLLAGGTALGIGAWIGKAGGQIRHFEFRVTPAAATNGAPHDHGAPEPSHETMQPSEAKPGHKHAATPEPGVEKTPLPDTLEGAWKAIHEQHAGLRSAVNDKNFREAQSHAKEISALARRLAELSHPDRRPLVETEVNKINRALEELRQSAETGSELVMKNTFEEFENALDELEQQMKNRN